MPDDLKKKRPLDASRINLEQEHEVNWWCSQLGVTPAKLKAAVIAVGTSADAVRKYLNK